MADLYLYEDRAREPGEDEPISAAGLIAGPATFYGPDDGLSVLHVRRYDDGDAASITLSTSDLARLREWCDARLEEVTQ